ncbi:cytochrome b/b6 domain-containing protein [Caballeronia grimmiae]
MKQYRPSATTKAATRIAAGDDRTSYDAVSIALHWLTVVLVLLQFALSQIWGFTPRPTRHLLIVTHMSFGILLSAVILVRILWRVSPRHQAPVASAGWLELAAKAVHYLLYALLVSEAILGFVLRWSGNESMSFFGFEIAPPFAPLTKATHQYRSSARVHRLGDHCSGGRSRLRCLVSSLRSSAHSPSAHAARSKASVIRRASATCITARVHSRRSAGVHQLGKAPLT